MDAASPELTDNATVVLERRYLSKDREGNVLEDPEGMFRRVARNLSQADQNYGASEEQRQATEEEFYQAMRRLEWLPNSPTLMNAGRELQPAFRLLRPARGGHPGVHFHHGEANGPDS